MSSVQSAINNSPYLQRASTPTIANMICRPNSPPRVTYYRSRKSKTVIADDVHATNEKQTKHFAISLQIHSLLFKTMCRRTELSTKNLIIMVNSKTLQKIIFFLSPQKHFYARQDQRFYVGGVPGVVLNPLITMYIKLQILELVNLTMYTFRD